jgi:23S rRNA pseudouridine955/2504/2580 synthase
MSTQHTVSNDDADIRLDRWFKRHFPEVSHGLLEKNLRKGQIRLDGKKAKASDRVYGGQVISIKAQVDGGQLTADGKEERVSRLPSPVRRVPSADDIQFVQRLVLYKDDNIIVVNKPYGLAVQGGSKITRSLDDLLDGLTFDAKERPKLTHRLDRDTSGCLVLARNAKAAHALMKLFSGRQIEKTYWALVVGASLPLNGTIDLPLIKKENPRMSGRPGGPEGRDYEIMQVDEKEGQKAITEYRTLDAAARRFAWMELKPLTGRTHQLRVHMQAIGCPILGDHKYGGSMEDAASLGVENILHLHARRIEIPSILGGKKTDVTAPLPPHMRKSFEGLGFEVPKK